MHESGSDVAESPAQHAVERILRGAQYQRNTRVVGRGSGNEEGTLFSFSLPLFLVNGMSHHIRVTS